MNAKIINIPTVNESLNNIEELLKIIASLIEDIEHSYTFSFSQCSYLNHSAIALLGAFANFSHAEYQRQQKATIQRADFSTLLKEEAFSIFMEMLKNNELKSLALKKLVEIKQQRNITLQSNEIINYFLQDLFNNSELLNLLTKRVKEKHTKNIGIMLDVTSMSNQLKNQLINCNFLYHFIAEYENKYPEGKYIGFRMHPKEDKADNIIQHVKNEWLTNDRVMMSPQLKQDIVSRIFELYQNAFGHGLLCSSLPLKVISCGSYDQDMQTISLSIVDLGGGICKNVREFAQKNKIENIIEDTSALIWALQRGNTTKTDSIDPNMPRGVGLDLLKEFVCLNQGKLEIFTNSCKAFINQSGEYEVSKLPFNFQGTMASITINCSNEIIYSYKGEDKFF